MALISQAMVNRQPVLSAAVIHSERCCGKWKEMQRVQMFTLDWLILSQFVTCWKMHVAYKGFAFFCFAVSTSLCIYPRMLTDRLSEPLCFSCWHREKDSKKAAMELLSWKGLWSSLLSLIQIQEPLLSTEICMQQLFIYSWVCYSIYSKCC